MCAPNPYLLSDPYASRRCAPPSAVLHLRLSALLTNHYLNFSQGPLLICCVQGGGASGCSCGEGRPPRGEPQFSIPRDAGVVATRGSVVRRVSISVRLKLLGLGRLGQLAQATVPVRCRRAGVVRRCLREVCYVPETRSLSQVFQRNDASFEGAPRSQGASCHSARLSRMGRRGPQHGRSRQPRRKPPWVGVGVVFAVNITHKMAPAGGGTGSLAGAIWTL